MCGRYIVTSSKDMLERRFNAKFDEPNYIKRYNASPSQKLPVILNSDPHKIKMLYWGIMPIWAAKIGRKDGLINIRTETLRDKKTFSKDLELRRCLILADGFYEWARQGKLKLPYLFQLKNKKPFSFAGLWEENTNKVGMKITTFAIITTSANPLLKKIHDRMPVILNNKTEKIWLSNTNNEEKLSLLSSYPASKMSSREVSIKVNDAKFDEPSLLLKIN